MIYQNEILWVTSVVLMLSLVLVSFKFFKLMGLYACIVFFSILVNLQTMKIAYLFGFPVVLGNIFYGGMFLATDIISEKYSKKEARNSILLAMLFIISFNVLFQLFLAFIPTEGSQLIQDSFVNIFGLFLPITIASFLTFVISQNVDIYIFHFVKKLTKDKYPAIRNNISTMSSQIVDTIVFLLFLMAFGVFDESFLQAIYGIVVLKIIIAFIDTPFFLMSRKIEV